jgi:hypothetical protein
MAQQTERYWTLAPSTVIPSGVDGVVVMEIFEFDYHISLDASLSHHFSQLAPHRHSQNYEYEYQAAILTTSTRNSSQDLGFPQPIDTQTGTLFVIS